MPLGPVHARSRIYTPTRTPTPTRTHLVSCTLADGTALCTTPTSAGRVTAMPLAPLPTVLGRPESRSRTLSSGANCIRLRQNRMAFSKNLRGSIWMKKACTV
eukprot:1161325-Pelagomonas_calceolata.AAC.17